MSNTQAGPNVQLYVQQKGWKWRLQGNQVVIQDCPLCGNNNWKFFINRENGKNDCKVCAWEGNLLKLKAELGDPLREDSSLPAQSTKDTSKQPKGKLPDIEALHAALLEHEDAIEYLTFERGFSLETIKAQKLGVDTVRDGKTWIVYPFFEQGQLVYAKWRTLPPQNKDFRGVQGRDQPLYNMDVIKPGMPELFFVEGEADCISMLNQGITGTVGVPGASTKKAEWIELVDSAKPRKMYLLYDTDKAGQDNAKEMAKRIGGLVYNIVLPAFEIEDADGNKKPGKDINEWFRAGHTLEEFHVLQDLAKPFEVAGVTGLGSALDKLVEKLTTGDDLSGGIVTPWPTLTKRIGKIEWGEVVGVIAEGKVGKTTFVINWLEWLVNQGYNSMLYCLEMMPDRIARKWVSHVMQLPDNFEGSKLTPESVLQAKEMAAKREAELFLGYTNSANPKDEVFDVIRQAVRRYGIKIVAFDNLQLLSRSEAHQQAELKVLSNQFKALAMELGIIIILIIQPNRVGENSIVSARNSAGTSSIEKDVDSMICLHRRRVGKMTAQDFETMGGIEVDENLAPEMLARVDLTRYAGGGQTTLWFDGETSTVSEMGADQKAALPKPAVGNTLPVEDDFLAA